MFRHSIPEWRGMSTPIDHDPPAPVDRHGVDDALSQPLDPHGPGPSPHGLGSVALVGHAQAVDDAHGLGQVQCRSHVVVLADRPQNARRSPR